MPHAPSHPVPRRGMSDSAPQYRWTIPAPWGQPMALDIAADGIRRLALNGGSVDKDHRMPGDDAPLRIREIAARASEQIGEYFAGRRRHFEGLPLDLRGTAFQKRVWEAMRRIPWGRTMTYGELAEAAGRPGAARAAGAACAANPIPIIIPCHRILASGGGLGGFSGGCGLETKRSLLALEGIHCRIRPAPDQRQASGKRGSRRR